MVGSEGLLLEAGMPNPSKLLWRAEDGVLLVVDGGSGLAVLDDTTVTRLAEVDLDSDANPALDGGVLYWGTGSGIMRLPLGAEVAELHVERPCGREGGWDFAVAALGGVLIDSRTAGYGLCRVDPDGSHRIVVLSGGDDDGADFESRIDMLATAVHFAPDGRLFTVDNWPGRRLRVITPN